MTEILKNSLGEVYFKRSMKNPYKDAEKVLEDLFSASYLGYDEAMNFLDFELSDCGNPQPATHRFLRLLRTWAEKDHVTAQYLLGRRMLLFEDEEAALECFRRAAEASYSPALFELSLFYRYGLAGLDIDIEKANRLEELSLL